MKHIGVFFGVVAVIIAISFFGISCGNNRPKFVPKSDSVFVLFRTPEGLQYRRATYTIEKVRTFEDSATTSAKWSQDTAWVLEMPNNKDTLKDPKGKPIYDSLSHQYKFNTYWYKLAPAENHIVRIQIVTI